MTYVLGVDLGTTYSAAAVADADGVRIFPLGSDRATIPSVVALRPDGTVLTGEAAGRRAVVEPARVAREFKRRLGDPVPIVVGSTPYGAETLMAHLLRDIVGRATEEQGRRPATVVLTHPAGYGPYKLDLLAQVGTLADLGDVDVRFLTEPQAAAIHYSGLERIEPGEAVAVYDLGGGTFDVAVVRATDGGFELIGTPGGMERFGGIDLDEAVFVHVRTALGATVDDLDPRDPATISALARLREDCRLAKEGLSADTDVTVPVMLPNVHTEVRLTRTEFEDMIRPRLRETLTTLDRVVRSAGIEAGDLSRVLLVGGSSRIPLVRELVREATGRPVALDANPKQAIALGGAAAGHAGAARTTARTDGAAGPTTTAATQGAPPAATARGSQPQAAPATATAPGQRVTDAGQPEPQPAAPTDEQHPRGTSPHDAEPAESGPVSDAQGTATASRTRGRGRLAAAVLASIALVVAAVAVVPTLLSQDATPGADDGGAVASDAGREAGDPGPDDPDNPDEVPEEAAEDPDAPDEVQDLPFDEFPPVEGPAPSGRVAVAYHTQYLGDAADSRWLAAAGAAIPDDLAADFYPELGPYDTTDPVVVAQHFAWMRAAGVGVALTVWDGVDSPSDRSVPTVLDVAAHYGVQVGFLPMAAGDPGRFTELVEEAIVTYGEHRSFHRADVEDRDPAPVFWFRPSDDDRDAWAAAFAAVHELPGAPIVLVDSTDPTIIEDTGADGLAGSALDDEDFAWARVLPPDAWTVPTLRPGVSMERTGNATATVERRDGDLLRDHWSAAWEAREPDLVLIFSFNSWRTGTQIEPALPDPPVADREYHTYAPLPPNGYLLIVRELIEAHLGL